MRGERARGSRAIAAASVLGAAAALAGCHGAHHPPDATRVPPPSPAFRALACADLYADDVLPTFEVDIAAADWAALQRDAIEGEEVYRPVVFRSGGEVVRNAMIRLRGNNSRCGDKLQFAIAFNQVDPDGRFHGLRRVNLDHGGCRLLEERLALSIMRDAGLPAPCANHARLVVNGRYYGLFLNVEHVNKDFLRRNFGSAADDGNLYKSGWRPRTKEASSDGADLVPYQAAADAAALAALVDLDEAIAEWAVEATLPARDNYWLRGYNYYLYHHPARGFLFIPTDLDQAFPATAAETSLATLLPDVLQRTAAVALADPRWARRYEEAVRGVVASLDPDALGARIDRYWNQVRAAASEDPFTTYSEAEVSALEARVRERARWLSEAVADPAAW